MRSFPPARRLRQFRRPIPRLPSCRPPMPRMNPRPTHGRLRRHPRLRPSSEARRCRACLCGAVRARGSVHAGISSAACYETSLLQHQAVSGAGSRDSTACRAAERCALSSASCSRQRPRWLCPRSRRGRYTQPERLTCDDSFDHCCPRQKSPVLRNRHPQRLRRHLPERWCWMALLTSPMNPRRTRPHRPYPPESAVRWESIPYNEQPKRGRL